MDDEAVAQLVGITGASEAVAQQVLEIAGGDLESAIALYFDNPGAFAPAASSSAPVLPEIGASSRSAQPLTGRQDEQGVIHIDSDDDDMRMDEDDDDLEEVAGAVRTAQEEEDAAMAKRLQEELYAENAAASDGIRAPIARTTETLLAPSYGMDMDDDEDRNAAIMEQLRRRRQAATRAQRPSPFSQNAWASGDPPGPNQNGEPSAPQQSRAARLAEMYRPPFELITDLPWDDARAEGREQKRWILINIQDMSDFNCQILNRDIWKDDLVKQIVKENFIFLQYTKEDPEASQYIQYYMQEGRHENPDNYPHVGIVDPRTGEQVKVWTGRPFPDALDFHAQLVEFLERYSLNANSKNPVAKTKARAPVKDVGRMTEEEMLEMALRNSLEGANGESSGPSVHDPDELTSGDDKGKGAAHTPVDLTASPAEPAGAAAASQSAFAGIPADRPHAEPPNNPASTTRIQFRHSGGRVIRRFATSDAVQRVYEWLKAEPLEGKEGVEFELKVMPQAKDLIEELGKTIEEAGLKQATVMIEFVE